MKLSMKTVVGAGFYISLFLMLGCGGPQQVTRATPDVPSDMPDWYLEPPGMCAVGDTKFRGNLGLARSSAITKARANLAKNLEDKVSTMLENYAAEGETSGNEFSEEQISDVSRSLAGMKLAGTKAKKVKVGKESGLIFALVCPEPELFMKAVEGMNELSAKRKAELKKAAEDGLNKMDAQLEKY